MTEKKFKYLIRDRNHPNSYCQGSAIYSSNIGTAILNELPSYISLEGDCSNEVIRSDNPLFKEILIKELHGTDRIMGLEAQINDLSFKLQLKMRNRDLIIETLRDIFEGK